MKKTIGFSFLIISLWLSHGLKAATAPTMENSILNLQSTYVDFSKPIKIEGECEFYWQKLLEPKDFADTALLPTPILGKIPKPWTSYSIDNQKLPREGYGTYRFTILKKPNSKPEIYGLKIPSIFTSYKLWVNGSLLTEVGTVGKSKAEHKPKYKSQDVPFTIDPEVANTERIEVVIQVSNYSHRRSGIPWAIYFGTFETLRETSRDIDILNLIVIGLILVIGINHLNMYFFRRKDVSNLYFGILTLVMILRNVSTGDRLVGYLFPNINWELLSKLDNFSGYGTIPLFALFIYHLFPKDFKAWLKNTIVVLGIIISLIIFATPASIYGKINSFFELYLLTGGLYLTFGVLLVATIRRRPGAIVTFSGMFILYATAFNDIFSSMGLISTPYLAPYGLATFMLLQSFTITSKSAKAINENEDLSHQLFLEKEGLAQKIEERTKELQQKQDKLLEHQEKEKQQNWLNAGFAIINDILSENKDNFKKLSRKILSMLVKRMGARYGVLYVITDDEFNEPYLEMVADFGCSKELKEKNAKISTDSGLVGATFTENQVQNISDIPEDYVKINSGLGESKPKSLLIAPLSTDEAVLGVVELASYNNFKPIEIEFIKKIAFSIAINLNIVKMNERNVNLIQQFQEQAESMQEKEEQMRLTLEELQYVREQNDALHQKIKAMENNSSPEAPEK